MDSFFSKLTRSVLGVGIESAYSASSFAGHLSDTTSPPYPDRPIHPLPKRRLRSRVSPETADSILYTGTSTPSKPLFSVPLDKPIASVSGSSRDPTSDRLPSSDLQEQPFGQEKHGYQFRGGDPDSDGEDADVLMQRCRAQRNRSYLYSNHNELRGGMTRASNVSIPMSAPSSQDSVDGYDSFENTNNKKKRKIPISGSSAGHHSSLSAEMASMGISTNRDSEFSQTEMDGGVGQYYGSGNFAVPAASSGNGISGAGRGRYARGTTRAPSGRGPLAVSTNGSNALQAGRQLFHKQDFTSTTQSSGKDLRPPSSSDKGIISAAIVNAVSLPSAFGGKENVSLLEQQASKKPSSSKTQFTFTCESDSGKNMAWQEQPAANMVNSAYNNLPTPNPPSTQAVRQRRDFATQGTQTSPNIATGANQQMPPQGPTSKEAQQPPRKPRRSLAKQLALAARQRRLQQQYDNYHRPPASEDTWICEFCEYEMIFGSPPEALIQDYELKDRQERRCLAEKRRLLEKAKMKGRKGKKGTKNSAQNANAANLAQQSASKQRYEQPLGNTPMQNQGTQSEDYLGDFYDDDPPPNPAPLPHPTTRIRQPIPYAQHQSLRSTTDSTGHEVGINSNSAC